MLPPSKHPSSLNKPSGPLIESRAPVNDTMQSAHAQGEPVEATLVRLGAPAAVRRFVANTMYIAAHGSTHEVCAAFFFGREEILPGVFEVRPL